MLEATWGAQRVPSGARVGQSCPGLARVEQHHELAVIQL